ncbi:MAG TPA: serine hydrolase [Pyrinomonadaceae bacterium]
MKQIRKGRILIFLCALFSINAFGQQIENIVEIEEITNALHLANVGKIVFLPSALALENSKAEDFLKEYEMKEKSDLHIRVFLGNSLTNYLHRLQPAASVDELTRNGRFQFAFYLDNTLIYRENLHPGAFGAENKNRRTVFRVPLATADAEDAWSKFLWNRFMLGGGDDALTPGAHLLKIEIRPFIDQPTARTGDIIAQGELKIIVPKPARELTDKEIQPQKIKAGSGWRVSNDDYDRKKIAELKLKIAENKFKNITAIVVVKNGKLLIEEYFNGAARETLHNTRSVGKSFASTITGIAIKDGYLKNENQTLSEFYDLQKFENYSPEKGSVTIKSLLTMSSGFNGSDEDENSPGNEEKMYPTSDWVKFALDLPMDKNKAVGKKWDYFTAGVVVVGDILDKSVPGGLEKYADKKLFAPLNIKNYKWQYTPQKVANTAGGLQMSALDFAKFGQLYKNKGAWRGKQIIPRNWAEASLTRHLPLPREGAAAAGYGYLFWNQTFKANEKQYEAFLSNGNGGNKIIVFSEQPLVIVVTATAYGKPYAHSQVDKIVEKYLLPAIVK